MLASAKQSFSISPLLTVGSLFLHHSEPQQENHSHGLVLGEKAPAPA